MTSWPNPSSVCATHSLSVAASSNTRARARPANHVGEVLARALNPSFDHLALRRQDADLTFPLVDVDANMVHGWSPCIRLERD